MSIKSISIFLFMICIFFNIQTTSAQVKLYSFEQIENIQKTEKRNILVFIHTDWCKFCQMMKNTTFKNDSIIQLLNDKFYFVSLNAEEKRNIVFNQHTFKYRPTGTNTGIHELADQLGEIDGKLSYPTLCILNTQNEIIFQYHEYLNPVDLIKILKRF